MNAGNVNYLKVCEPAAALAADPPNPPCPGNPNCGAALAAQTTANNTMKNFILRVMQQTKNFELKEISNQTKLRAHMPRLFIPNERCSRDKQKKEEIK